MKHVRDLVKDLPAFQSCEQCKETPGWVTVMRAWGEMQVPSQQRCVCWSIHQQKIVEAIAAKGKQKREGR